MLQVPCKHCGQQASVEDLLQAAEQPCPHCGQPLLDDAPAVASPAPSPTGPGSGPSDLASWWMRNRVAMSRDEALQPPPMVCICCGAAATRVVEESYQTRFATSLASQFFRVRVPYCDVHYRKYVRWLVIAGGVLLFMLAPVLLWMFRPDYLADLGLPWQPSLVCNVCMLIGVVVVLVYSSLGVRFVAYDQELIEARNVSPAFILAMHERRARRLGDSGGV